MSASIRTHETLRSTRPSLPTAGLRAQPLRDYCTGLMLPCERKSVEPIAAVTAPARVAAQHQSLLHFIGERPPWSDERGIGEDTRVGAAADCAARARSRRGSSTTRAFPSRAGIQLAWPGSIAGNSARRTIAKSPCRCPLANSHASLPVAYRLYLPQEWTRDRARLRKTGVPAEISFKTKHEIALDQLRWACSTELPRGVVLMDAGYGNNSDFRAQISALGLQYVAGIQSNTTVWPTGTGPLPAKAWSGRGRPPKRLQRDAEHWPVSVKELALNLPKRAWRTIEWREGTAERLSSRFARVREFV